MQNGQPPVRQNNPSRTPIIVVISIAFVFVCLFAVICYNFFFRVIPQANQTCAQRNDTLFARETTLLAEFNSYAFVPSQPDVTASVNKYRGDCFETSPSITISKVYTIAETAEPDAFSTASSAVLAAGYKEVNNDSSHDSGSSCPTKKYENKAGTTITISCTYSTASTDSPDLPTTSLLVNLVAYAPR